ncbi:MAG: two-component system, NarL family, sensor kinase [Frankiaceae bacterium]|nr:two-component system, NarL family, sensor kinase [Frankiaceae bacterium]
MTTAARETRAGEITHVLRAAQVLVAGRRDAAAVPEVLALLCAMTGASCVTLRHAQSGAETVANGSPDVAAPSVVRQTLPVRCDDDELAVLTIAGAAALSVAQEQAAALIGDLLALYLVAGRRTDELTAAYADRRRIAARIIDATERERDELAGQLHDGPLQSLVAARYVTDMAGMKLRDGSFDEASEGVQAGLVNARRALWQLRPHAVDGQDLPGALSSLGKQLGDYIGLRVEVVTDGVPPALPPAVASAAFRVVQEMLSAAVRDRAATRASVTAQVEGATLVVVVSDDGVGQVVEIPAGVARWREWVSLLGGDVRMRGKRGGGAWLQARLPLSDSAIEKRVTQ